MVVVCVEVGGGACRAGGAVVEARVVVVCVEVGGGAGGAVVVIRVGELGGMVVDRLAGVNVTVVFKVMFL